MVNHQQPNPATADAYINIENLRAAASPRANALTLSATAALIIAALLLIPNIYASLFLVGGTFLIWILRYEALRDPDAPYWLKHAGIYLANAASFLCAAAAIGQLTWRPIWPLMIGIGLYYFARVAAPFLGIGRTNAPTIYKAMQRRDRYLLASLMVSMLLAFGHLQYVEIRDTRNASAQQPRSQQPDAATTPYSAAMNQSRNPH